MTAILSQDIPRQAQYQTYNYYYTPSAFHNDGKLDEGPSVQKRESRTSVVYFISPNRWNPRNSLRLATFAA